ncbi:MAG: S8 family serine peptidase, partial [Actinomycetota bacterium]|nr:S8 family serine peptidase [Actinomycetota bacterium]
ATSARDIERYFTRSERSQDSALEREAKAWATAGGRRRAYPAVAAAAQESLRAAAALGHRPVIASTEVPETEPPPLVRYYPNLGLALGTVTREGLDELIADPQVDEVIGTPQLSLIRPTKVAAAKLEQLVTWGIAALDVPELWSQGLSGEGVVVGHLDTGADGTHPGLADAIGHFAEFDFLGRQVVPDPAPHDTDEHGTHTAGTIAGRSVDGKSFGVAPAAKLASAIVIEGGQVIARILGGMDWIVGQGARVLSMSLGLRGFMDDFEPLTRILRANGVLPVFAIGNEGPGTSRSPGNYSEALSVGAMDTNHGIASFSSSHQFDREQDAVVPDVVAPGADVVSAKPGGGFQLMDGTSMATPHVAGLAALLLQAKPSATVDELEQALFRSCALEPGWRTERAGRGLPHGPAALMILTEGAGVQG